MLIFSEDCELLPQGKLSFHYTASSSLQEKALLYHKCGNHLNISFHTVSYFIDVIDEYKRFIPIVMRYKTKRVFLL